VAVGLSGCYGTIARRTGEFSQKAAPALVETRGVYTLVESTHARRKRAEAIAAYDTTAFNAVDLAGQFGSDADLKARTAVIELLQRYLDALAEVSGDKALAGMDSPSEDAGKAVTSLAKKDLPALVASADKARAGASAGTGSVGTSGAASAGSGTTPSTSSGPTNSGSATTTATTTSGSASSKTNTASASGSTDSGPALAIDAIGHVIVERKRAKALPGILAAADGPVKTLCELLRADIGDPHTGGLRYVLRMDYEGLETAEDAAIRDHPKDYSYPERRAAIDALYGLVGEQAASDATLVEADQALADFEKTHAALAASARQKRAPGFRALLAELTSEAEQLGDLEKSMGKTANSSSAGSSASGGK
jgi:hypothetical protein